MRAGDARMLRPAAVAQERRGDRADLARAWIECRAEVLCATTRSFPTVGSANIEVAVDRAWAELYEEGRSGPPDGLPARWKALAYLRALNGVRERRRHPISCTPVEELAKNAAVVDRAVQGSEALRAEARAQEIVGQVSGDARRWLEAVFEAPAAPPRELAQTLGWEPEKLKSVARRTRPRLREFVSARATGLVCERRQAVMDAFAATHLERRDPVLAVRLQERQMLSSEFYEQVALHIAGCEECERAWRGAQSRLLRGHLVFIPVALAGRLAAAGASVAASGRRALGRLDRLLSDLRLRVGSSMGRATAGGAAGTAGTAGALAGKGAAVCAGLLCASSVGAALVALPPGIIHHSAAHHRHRMVTVHSGQGDSGSPAAATALAASYGQALAGQRASSSTPAGQSSQGASTARAVGRSTRPATPGDLIASSSTASRKPESRPAAIIATAASTRAPSPRTPSAIGTSTSSQTYTAPRASQTGSSTCVPGSLSC